MSLSSFLRFAIVISSVYVSCAQEATTTLEPSTDQDANFISVTTYQPLEIHLGNETIDTNKYNKYETINSEAENETVLSSAFDTKNYVNECPPNENRTRFICNGDESVLCEGCEENLRQVSVELCESFQNVTREMMYYSCYVSETVRKIAMNMAEIYLQQCKEFVEKISYTPLGGRTENYVSSMESVKHMMKALDQSFVLREGYVKVVKQISSVSYLQENVGSLNRSKVYTEMENEQALLVQYLKDDITAVKDFHSFLQKHELETIFNAGTLAAISNLPYFEDEILPLQEQLLKDIQENLVMQKTADVMQHEVRITFVVIVLLIGLSGNTLLLSVFIRYKDMRTIANLMLINLTVVDSICLIINLPVSFYRSTNLWTHGVWSCKAYYFLRIIVIMVSTYSIVMICIQRYLAVNSFPKAGGCTIGNRTKTFLMVTSVWLFGIIYAIPRMIFSQLDNGMCGDSNHDVINILAATDFVIICIIPSTLMAVFSALTASSIKRSVSSAPGERTGQEQLKKDRMLSAHVLTALAVLFVISYFPNFTFYFVTRPLKVELDLVTFNVLDNMVYYLQFANACLNPLALGIMSKKYRKYYMELMSLCRIPVKLKEGQASSDASVATTESTI